MNDYLQKISCYKICFAHLWMRIEMDDGYVKQFKFFVTNKLWIILKQLKEQAYSKNETVGIARRVGGIINGTKREQADDTEILLS